MIHKRPAPLSSAKHGYSLTSEHKLMTVTTTKRALPQETQMTSAKLSEKDKSYAVQLYGNEFRTESRIHDWIYVYTMC